MADFVTNFMLMSLAVRILLCLFATILLFVPVFVAAYRGHRNFKAILGLTVLLGWTFFGWAIAVVWALTENKRESGGRREIIVEGGQDAYSSAKSKWETSLAYKFAVFAMAVVAVAIALGFLAVMDRLFPRTFPEWALGFAIILPGIAGWPAADYFFGPRRKDYISIFLRLSEEGIEVPGEGCRFRWGDVVSIWPADQLSDDEYSLQIKTGKHLLSLPINSSVHPGGHELYGIVKSRLEGNELGTFSAYTSRIKRLVQRFEMISLIGCLIFVAGLAISIVMTAESKNVPANTRTQFDQNGLSWVIALTATAILAVFFAATCWVYQRYVKLIRLGEAPFATWERESKTAT